MRKETNMETVVTEDSLALLPTDDEGTELDLREVDLYGKPGIMVEVRDSYYGQARESTCTLTLTEAKSIADWLTGLVDARRTMSSDETHHPLSKKKPSDSKVKTNERAGRKAMGIGYIG